RDLIVTGVQTCALPISVLLRGQADAGPVGPAALVAAAERGRGCPGGRHQLRGRQARSEDFGLEVGDVLLPDQLVIDGGDRVLPEIGSASCRGGGVAGVR